MPKWLRRLFGIKDDPKPAPPIAPQPTISPPVGQPSIQPPPVDPMTFEPVRPPSWASSKNPPYPGIPVEPPYPATHNWGDWRDVQEGESPDAYQRRTGLGGYGRTGAELKQLEDERHLGTEIGKIEAATVFHGPVPYTEATDEELKFLTYAQHNFRLPMGLMYAVFAGPKAEIDQLIGKGDLIGVGYNAETYPREGRMRGLVDQYSTGALTIVRST